MFIAGESPNARATVATLKTCVAEDVYWCDVWIYNLSAKTPLYSSTSHLLSICSSAAFQKKLPRYVVYREGPMSSVLPIEIFS